jgi:lysophospholipase L1-like esterase
MKKSIFFLILSFSTFISQMDAQQQSQQTWAFFEKYQAANTILKQQPDYKGQVVLMGNSITEFWVNFDPIFFAENRLIGRGISGQTTPQMLLRFQQDVVDLSPKIVIINAGINDIAENTGPYDRDMTLKNIFSMAQIAKANKIKVVLSSILPADAFPWRPEIKNIAEKVLELNALIKKYADENKIVYLDYHTIMKNAKNGLSPELAEDGVHPTIAGYKIMEKLVLEAIKKAKKRRY